MKNGVVKHFAKFTGKHLCRNFFDKVVGFQPSSSVTVIFLSTTDPLTCFFKQEDAYADALNCFFFKKIVHTILEILDSATGIIL